MMVKGQEDECMRAEHRVCRWDPVQGSPSAHYRNYRCTYVPTESSGS